MPGAKSRLGGNDFVQEVSEAEYLSNATDFLTGEPIRGDIVSIDDVSGGRVTLANGMIRFEINPSVSDLSGSTVGVRFDFTLADGRTYSATERFSYFNLITKLIGDLEATIEEFYSGSGDDTIFGNAADNVLYGGAGADHIDARAGDDLVIGGSGRDTLIGGSGFDTVSFEDVQENLTIDLERSSVSGPSQSTSISGFEAAIGGGGDDYLVGTAETATRLFGGGGNDTLVGGLGADVLTGGDGDDVIYGG
ncbi:calcium-binding protein [Parvularcula dongshanensis]|uniref:Ca2+-binding RTX toxin-like protein n=1 Tax=Parvularcula dongshanensis TaxID=1173995 RepID=A0A840I6P2_9PROT|nr:hypothetical protein [Parvularcula dongshanensis]MBB4659975.1 Ca2+-binding RTX toxin-like protein [Parvularcula dongshanensis]